MKYILEHPKGELTLHEDRPTQSDLKALNELGDFALYRGDDGTQIIKWDVRTNRNGNLAVDAFKASGLSSVRTRHMHTMLKAYERIVKHWPAKDRDVQTIHDELDRRSALLDSLVED